MISTNSNVPASLQAYVNDIIILHNHDGQGTEPLSFYADGFPGVMFIQSATAALLKPKNKVLSSLFLYGQTIEPIEIEIRVPYTAIIFQLHPFVARTILGIPLKTLNDDCYALLSDNDPDAHNLLSSLTATKHTGEQVEQIADFLRDKIEKQSASPHQKIKLALDLVIVHKGNISVKRLTEELKITERSLQRLFIDYVGVSPKQFAKIIQFQHSLTDISAGSYQKLTDIVYENGYADQSHFIRDFKKYTGKKPTQHQKKK
jgi:AraC-like DNA-binding protein